MEPTARLVVRPRKPKAGPNLFQDVRVESFLDERKHFSLFRADLSLQSLPHSAPRQYLPFSSAPGSLSYAFMEPSRRTTRTAMRGRPYQDA